MIAKECLELLFNDSFDLTPLSFIDEVLNLSNKFNKNDLDKCFEHYCIAKPTDYMLRRTHLSWFNKNGGEKDIQEIVKNFDINGVKTVTLKELADEGLFDV